jgi:hypothetical protein
LRTLLGSIETFTTPSPGSRGYLSYVTGFLRRMGVRLDAFTEKGELLAEPEDPFIEVGEAWALDHDQVARGEFLLQAAALVRAGQGERVAEVAQMLLAQTRNEEIEKELMRLAVTAQMGQTP